MKKLADDRIILRRYEWQGLTKEQWKDFLGSACSWPKYACEIILILFHSPNYALNAKKIGEIVHSPGHAPLNLAVVQLGKRLYSKYLSHTELQHNSNGGIRWWVTVFDGEDTRVNGKPICDWILKKELVAALTEAGTSSLERCVTADIDFQ